MRSIPELLYTALTTQTILKPVCIIRFILTNEGIGGGGSVLETYHSTRDVYNDDILRDITFPTLNETCSLDGGLADNHVLRIFTPYYDTIAGFSNSRAIVYIGDYTVSGPITTLPNDLETYFMNIGTYRITPVNSFSKEIELTSIHQMDNIKIGKPLSCITESVNKKKNELDKEYFPVCFGKSDSDNISDTPIVNMYLVDLESGVYFEDLTKWRQFDLISNNDNSAECLIHSYLKDNIDGGNASLRVVKFDHITPGMETGQFNIGESIYFNSVPVDMIKDIREIRVPSTSINTTDEIRNLFEFSEIGGNIFPINSYPIKELKGIYLFDEKFVRLLGIKKIGTIKERYVRADGRLTILYVDAGTIKEMDELKYGTILKTDDGDFYITKNSRFEYLEGSEGSYSSLHITTMDYSLESKVYPADTDIYIYNYYTVNNGNNCCYGKVFSSYNLDTYTLNLKTVGESSVNPHTVIYYHIKTEDGEDAGYMGGSDSAEYVDVISEIPDYSGIYDVYYDSDNIAERRVFNSWAQMTVNPILTNDSVEAAWMNPDNVPFLYLWAGSPPPLFYLEIYGWGQYYCQFNFEFDGSRFVGVLDPNGTSPKRDTCFRVYTPDIETDIELDTIYKLYLNCRVRCIPYTETAKSGSPAWANVFSKMSDNLISSSGLWNNISNITDGLKTTYGNPILPTYGISYPTIRLNINSLDIIPAWSSEFKLKVYHATNSGVHYPFSAQNIAKYTACGSGSTTGTWTYGSRTYDNDLSTYGWTDSTTENYYTSADLSTAEVPYFYTNVFLFIQGDNLKDFIDNDTLEIEIELENIGTFKTDFEIKSDPYTTKIQTMYFDITHSVSWGKTDDISNLRITVKIYNNTGYCITIYGYGILFTECQMNEFGLKGRVRIFDRDTELETGCGSYSKFIESSGLNYLSLDIPSNAIQVNRPISDYDFQLELENKWTHMTPNIYYVEFESIGPVTGGDEQPTYIVDMITKLRVFSAIGVHSDIRLSLSDTDYQDFHIDLTSLLCNLRVNPGAKYFDLDTMVFFKNLSSTKLKIIIDNVSIDVHTWNQDSPSRIYVDGEMTKDVDGIVGNAGDLVRDYSKSIAFMMKKRTNYISPISIDESELLCDVKLQGSMSLDDAMDKLAKQIGWVLFEHNGQLLLKRKSITQSPIDTFNIEQGGISIDNSINQNNLCRKITIKYCINPATGEYKSLQYVNDNIGNNFSIYREKEIEIDTNDAGTATAIYNDKIQTYGVPIHKITLKTGMVGLVFEEFDKIYVNSDTILVTEINMMKAGPKDMLTISGYVIG